MTLFPDVAAGGLATVCRAWALVRADGLTLGFTDHDRTLTFDGTDDNLRLTGISSQITNQTHGVYWVFRRISGNAGGSGYNPTVTGADALLSPAAKKNFQESFPGNALENLWHRPAEPSWFGELRTQYADKFKSA